ncbi:MAG: NUDIX hydrolase [Caldiserica bacterium]|jgi:ADP-ribose pyrophosphatase|nr:NUDIX hydrolase [Caldisericota bacterium]MDH7562922.1 NUDIX hydrolase [Caldisericota bacterium]
MEKRIKQNLVYKGKLLSLEVLEVLMPSGFRTTREVIYHPGAVAVIALNSQNQVLLVRQYRTALRDFTWEIPAGKLEKGENPLKCAQRELLEETGYEAKIWQFLFSFFPSPGYSNEVIHLFLAQGLVEKQPKLEADEEITFSFFSLEELNRMIKPSQPFDGKTLLALMYLNERNLSKNNPDSP